MLDDEPALFADLMDVWEAWHTLSADRQGGMGARGTPWQVLDRYAERHGVDDFDEFHDLIRAMDAEYLDYANRKD